MEAKNPRMKTKRSYRKRKTRKEEAASDTEELPRKVSKAVPSGPLPDTGRPLKLPEVLELLTHPGKALDSIPHGEKTNAYFIVKCSLSPWKIHKGGFNGFPDDCGMWDRNGSTKLFQYIGNINGNWKALVLIDNLFYEKTVSMPLLNPQPDMDSVVKVHHFYTYHSLNTEYKRRITVLSGIGFREDRGLVEYSGCLRNKFSVPMPFGVPEKVEKQGPPAKRPRGRPRKEKPEVRDSNQVPSAEEVDHRIMMSELAPKVPREKQVMLSMLVESPSVQAVISRRDQRQCVILYHDDQLSDMKRNLECENVLGVDCTHKFGDCYLTLTVYQNARALHKTTNESLLFLGPAYLHWDTDFSTYVSFFSHVMDKLDGIEPTIEVKLGSDVGLDLFKALKFTFRRSSHVLDCHHLRQTVDRDLLDECEMKGSERSVIIKKVFGLEGLTSSPTMLIFIKRLSDLAPYFEEFPKLRNYFIKMKVILYEYYCEPLQKGVFPKLWGGSKDEVLNSHIEAFLPERSCEFPLLVRKVGCISTLLMQYIDDRCE